MFTDIEGSTQLLKRLRDRYGEALEDHQRILRKAFVENGGHEIDTQGDSFFVAFRRAKDAVYAAIAGQRGLAEHAWPDEARLRVRMGIHTGEPAVGGESYVGLGVHRAARICAAGHGGQVLASQTTRELLRDDPIPAVSLLDLGEHQLKDMDGPERLYQLVAPGLVQEFRELKTAAPGPFEGREGELAEAAAEQMARSWRRPGRRVLIAATFAAAVAGAALGVLLTHGGGSAADASVGANELGVIDGTSGRIVSSVRVGGSPGQVAGGPDAVWVTNGSDNKVLRVDPSTNDVVQSITVGGGPVGVAASAGAVWVANGLDGTVSRIDPTVNQVVGDPIRVGNGPTGVAYGEGAVWVTNSADGTVSRIAPGSGRVVTFPAVVGASGVAVGFHRVWITSPSSASVVALDPRSGRVVKSIGVGGDPDAVAVGAGAVWVASRADDTVWKLDRKGSVQDVIPVGRGPIGIAAGAESVWVANGSAGTLVSIDPKTDTPSKPVRLGNPPRGLAMEPQGIYVAVRSTGLEHHGGTLRALTLIPVASIDPALAGYAPGSLLTMTNDGLVAFRKVGGVEGSQLVPDLAIALPTPTDGGTTYTFYLRSGIRYSNGKVVQPEDFRRAIERLFEVKGSVGTIYFGGIDGADRCLPTKPCDLSRGIVADRAARTVTFRLTEPDAEFLNKLALSWAVAVPDGTPGHDLGTHPVPATGPYRIAGLATKLRTVRLVRNRAFREWSADAQPKGFPDSISISWPFADAHEHQVERGVAKVERGVADIALATGPPMPKPEIDRLAVHYPSQLHISTLAATSFYFLNTRVPPFNDVRARRAVNAAFDRNAFALQQGRGFTPTCQILPPNIPAYRPTCPYPSGGPNGVDIARRLVKSSGTAGTPITVWVIAQIAGQARYVVSVLNSIGYQAHLKAADSDTYFFRLSDSRLKIQMGYMNWASDYPSAAAFIPPLLSCAAFVPASPGQNSNYSGFCDHSIDAQMFHAAAVQVDDPAAATKLWQRVERSILAQAPLLPVYNRSDVVFVSKRVRNYQYNPQWSVLLDQLWVK